MKKIIEQLILFIFTVGIMLPYFLIIYYVIDPLNGYPLYKQIIIVTSEVIVIALLPTIIRKLYKLIK
jgi:hypothetical protein